MKSCHFFVGRLLLPAAFISFSASAKAATITKEDNTIAISSAGSWVGGVLPAPGDIMLFDGTIIAPLTTAGASSMSDATAFQFTTIGGNVTVGVNNGATITLNNSSPTYAIDMSAATADVTIGTTVGSSGTIRWASGVYSGISVASGRTLTMNSSLSNAGNTKTTIMTGAGNIVFNGSAGSGGAMGFSIQGGANVTMNGVGGWSGSSSKEIINGTLNLGHDSALGGATLTLGGTSATTPTLTAVGGARIIDNSITIAAVTTGSATIAGSNALTVNGTLFASGGPRTLTVNNSALTTFGGSVLLSSDNTTTGRGLTIGGTGNTAISGVIANNNAGNTLGATLTYNGSGTLTLSNTNTYSGTTTISSGTVKIGNSRALGTDRTSLATVATVDLNGTNLNLASLYNGASLSGGIVDNVSAGGNVTLTIGSGIGGNTGVNADYLSIAAFSGVIQNTTGTVGLTKVVSATPTGGVGIMATASRLTGANVFTLTGANTYTGATTVKGGFLQLLQQNTTPIISSSSALVLQGGGLVLINNTGVSPTQTFAGTTLNAGASQVTAARQSSTSLTVNLGAITRNIGSSVNFASRPTNTGSNGKLGAGDGTITTSTANTGGILGGYAVANGNTWAVGGGTISGLALASYSTTLTAATNVDVPSAGLTGGGISVNSLRFLNSTTATTTPTLTLTGDLVVTTGGILTVGGANDVNNSTAVANASITGNYNLTSGNSQDLIFHTNNLGGTGVATMTVSSNITNNGGSIGLTKSGTGTLTLTPATANTFTGQLTINAGNLVLGNANALNGNDVVFGGSSQFYDNDGLGLIMQNGTLTLGGNSNTAGSLASSADSSGTAVVQNVSANSATLTLNGSANTSYAGTFINGTGAGTLGLTKSGSGTQTLTNVTNSFTGDINIGGGILAANASNNITNPATSALGNVQVARNLNVNNGGTLRFDAGDTFGGADTVMIATLAINSGGTVTNNGSSYTTLGPVSLNGGTLTGVGGSGNTQYQMYGFGGDVTVGGSSAATISGSGTTSGYHLGTSASGRTGTTFTVADATSSTASDLNVSAALIDRTGGLGAASLTKSGAGTMTLSGTNTYTGSTTVNAGTLAINGIQSAATGAVSVSNAGTRLIGTGTVGGDTTINTGAIQSAGGAIANVDKIGKQTFDETGGATANLTYGAGSIFEWDLNTNKDTDGYDDDSNGGTPNTNVGTRGEHYDAVDVTGTLTVNATAIFRVVLGSTVGVSAGTFWQQEQSWTDIFGGGFTPGGSFDNSLLQVVDTSGNTYNQDSLFTGSGYGFSVSGTTLSWSAVPEPTSAIAGLLLGAGLLRRRRAWA